MKFYSHTIILNFSGSDEEQPGSNQEHNSATRSVKDGGDGGQMKYSGQVTKDKARKKKKHSKSKDTTFKKNFCSTLS